MLSRSDMIHVFAMKRCLTVDDAERGGRMVQSVLSLRFWPIARCKMPIIRCRLKSRYRLVGEAYVHGLMHGLAFATSVTFKTE